MNEKNKALQTRFNNMDEDILTDELVDVLFDNYFSAYEAALSLMDLVIRSNSDEELAAINNTCIAILGWSLETLISNAEERSKY